ncbi:MULTISPECIES: thiol:disulfide interchange protein DsbG [unclassified Delftia]|uniref:thiol:disulfide interchange protein DsbG n=1 Tax=unclassified Delftia TaxID=2613839 RepID=UPI001900A0C4|nr:MULTISPECIES: thiol:disulfide interchange protein DsbG [unclassified Delftia]MBK0114085.1 thiol:disulfide interchange protein DsbG [Delftia sp. S65]MBK0117893.1 thiol:disulfide interchange protein DsbG [Delftia sp. S67]MBK0129108.1 thiol:disulfide interchange protein DsbG [Delftia sp. S66]
MKIKKIILATAISTALICSASWAAPTKEAAESLRIQTSAWKRLESAKWVRDGKEDAPRIVYVITDPNCIWCHRFWEASRPWVDAGKVQIRHILVGIIKDSSEGKAAAILSAQDTASSLKKHELSSKQGGISELKIFPDSIKKALADNLQLMKDFGFRGTPAIIYSDTDGDMVAVSGYPREQLEAVMGSALK